MLQKNFLKIKFDEARAKNNLKSIKAHQKMFNTFEEVQIFFLKTCTSFVNYGLHAYAFLNECVEKLLLTVCEEFCFSEI